MQKARRVICSKAPQSPCSTATERFRKKIRTPSEEGDIRSRRTTEESLAVKSKLRHDKLYDFQTPGSMSKNTKKPTKPSRAPRPNLGSFQNAIVLAPFHTLKKCFQSKLVDLYSTEKMKKLNHKVKMAKKQNMSFEYDIVEMEPLPSNVKKEGKAQRRSKKSRSASYCECPRNRELAKVNQGNNRNSTEKMNKQEATKMRARKPFSAPRYSKKRKLMDLKLESALEPSFVLHAPERLHPSEANISSSAVSSPSKSDTWETYSNHPSCKEERMQGSFAISTTSFDSCLEHFDSENLDQGRPMYRKHPQKSQRNLERMDAEFHKKPTADTSRHLIVHVDRKNSDDQIVDFMDREPQSQVIASEEPNRQWHPLKRQSRPKEKKAEKDAVSNYFLRSLSSSREKIPGEKNLSFLHGNLHIEIGTQVGESNLKFTKSSSEEKSGQEQSAIDASHAMAAQEQTPEVVEDSNPQPPPRASAPDVESPDEFSQPRTLDIVEEPLEYLASREVDGEMSILRMHSEFPSPGSVPGLRGEPAEFQQSLENSCNYIFGEGARESVNRLGGTCEFSFGLNWVSDDED